MHANGVFWFGVAVGKVASVVGVVGEFGGSAVRDLRFLKTRL